MTSTCFTICFAKVIQWDTNDMRVIDFLHLSNIAKARQWDDFFNHSNAVVLKDEERKSSESFQRGTILCEKFIYTIDHILLLLHW